MPPSPLRSRAFPALAALLRSGAAYRPWWALSAASLVALSSPALASAPASKPGGSGKVVISGTGHACFKTASEKVPRVCGAPTVHYKLSTLMGDPVGNYGLTWTLSSVQLANGNGKGTQTYHSGNLPPAIWEAAKTVELSLYATARVHTGTLFTSGPVTAIRFDTGLGVKPDGKVSFNIASGYDWHKFLRTAKSDISAEHWACKEATSRWLPAEDAKALMRRGVQLSDLQICADTRVNVDRLERALLKACQAAASPPPAYCPPSEATSPPENPPAADPFAELERGRSPSPGIKGPDKRAKKQDAADPFASLESGKTRGGAAPGDDMENAFTKAEAERVTTVERKRRYDAAYASCQRDQSAQEACSVQAHESCGRQPSRETCLKEVYEPGSCNPTARHACIALPVRRCVEHGTNPRLTEWENCRENAPQQCTHLGKAITNLAACATERARQ